MKLKKYIVYVLIVLMIAFGVFRLITWMNYSVEITYELSEIQDGIYVVKYDSISTVPAKNFTCAEYCVNDNLCELRGDVSIKYVNNNPHVEMKIYPNATYGDSATFYVPKGTVITNQSVGTGRR